MFSDLFNFRFNKQEVKVLDSLRQIQKDFNKKICNNPILGTHKFKEALIMGGAVRDLWLKNSENIKDVDIFININLSEVKEKIRSYDEYNIDSLNSICKKNNIKSLTNKSTPRDEKELYIDIIKFILEENFEQVELVSNKNEGFDNTDLNYSYDDLTGVLGIFKITDSNLPYQVDAIFLTGDILEFRDNIFDFSLNKINLNKNGAIVLHDDFTNSIKNKIITYCPSDVPVIKEISDYQFTVRLNNLLEKYPNFKFELSDIYYDFDTVLESYMKFEEIQQLKKDKKTLLGSILEIQKEPMAYKNKHKL